MKEIDKKILIDIVGAENVISEAPMSEYTSFKAGGKADLLVEPQSTEELAKLLRVLNGSEISTRAEDTNAHAVPYMIIGNGSNILVRDGGYRGVIVRIGNAFNYMKIDGERLVCGAGTLLSAIAKKAAKAALSGFEFASGIPGSIGGAVFMNAGAYDGEIKDIIEEVHLISADGTRDFIMKADELKMGYRCSAIQQTGDIVTEVVLKLNRGDQEEIKEKMADLAAKRNSKQPVQYPSAGSFFKRPEGHFAGKLVQDAGCKGLAVGGAEVSTLHSGFIINKGGATASDIIRLKELVQAIVKEQFQVDLEPEVCIVGEDAEVPETPKDNADNYEMLYDLHTHTTYSHGKGSIEDNVRVALEKGLEYIAISDHGPGHIFYGVSRNDFPNIRNDINKMTVKYQSIHVRNSIEANIIHCTQGSGKGSNGLDVSPEEFNEFDFVIAGFHFGCLGCSSVRNWLWSHGIKPGEKSLKKSNTEMVINALKKNDIAILTHPGDKGPFDIEAIAKACAETETLIEINARHGHLTEDEIKIAMKEPGLKFIISSDAHTADAVGSYRTALQRAFDAGLDVSRIVNIREKIV